MTSLQKKESHPYRGVIGKIDIKTAQLFVTLTVDNSSTVDANNLVTWESHGSVDYVFLNTQHNPLSPGPLSGI